MTDDEKRRWKGPSDKRGTSGRRMGERKIIAHRAKNESSKRWIERQLQDPYVQKARSEGYRARAAYKLLEIEEKLHLFRRGQRVVDLGCAPGGWLQVAGIKGASEIAGIDLLPVEPLAGVHIVQGDINEPGDVAELMKGLTGPPDLVLSDMAANTTGHKQTDHLRTVALVEMAAAFAVEHLAPGGTFCSKVFQGGATKEVLDLLKANFTSVKHIKPPASRAGSPEIFVVAKGFRGSRKAG
ncbi:MULTISPECIES: RlmE family RNA methyltransferase [Hyphomonas]|uniref:Ribosomal RNA large subunit methyltransferase E n=2 Tax=Hyphomonas adhaerens TaxID=81029 RepID=A0A069E7E9_9PROT|nr:MULTISPECIES: RlmE family RNA methyltransferase [Hyphomonas]KCZ83557.1 23S rRNA methyltransferase J [Hyphomonas adhaerens MHS-3]MBB41078.1 RlmE family RNA methyltransferase [Hyphomonas sp.]HAE26105.1 RlmE family RNA methyltransferase [Hyphomonas adhaerens]|tara:strand:+ start:1263 stop:1982 length:720 start_codon:yes stop_codon:yes gene_type:complete